MDRALEHLLSLIEALGVRIKQVLALHFVKALSVETTSSVIGISEEKVRKIIKVLNEKFLGRMFGQYFGDEKVIREINEGSTDRIKGLFEYEGEVGKSKREINENWEYYSNKFVDYMEERAEVLRKKRGRNTNKFNFTDRERRVLHKHWCWQIYVPKSLKEEDINDYRSSINTLIIKGAEKIFINVLEVDGEAFFSCFGELLLYYVEDFTINQIAEMLEVSREDVFSRFEKARDWLNYTMSDYYELEHLHYTGNEERLPGDEVFKNIIELRLEQVDGAPLSRDLLDNVMSAYWKIFLRNE